MPLHRNSIQHGPTYSGKNAIVNAPYPISPSYGSKQTRTDQHTNRVVLRNGVYEQSGQSDRTYTSFTSKNNMSSSSRSGYSTKGLAFAPGFYCRKMEKEPQTVSAPPKFNNSFPKSTTGNIKYHADKEKITPGAQHFSTGIVGTVLTGNGQSKLTYYQARDVTLDWPLHSNYKQQRRVCSALASKRKVPSVIS